MRLLPVIAIVIALASPAAAQPRFRTGKPGGKIGAGRDPKSARKQLDRLNSMSPEDRKRALDRLPPDRRKEAEKRLEQYHQLSTEEKDRLFKGLEDFQSLSPERQKQVRRLFARFNQTVPPDRRPMLRQELIGLRQLGADERRSRMNSDEFRNKYSAQEQQLLADLAAAFGPD